MSAPRALVLTLPLLLAVPLAGCGGGTDAPAASRPTAPAATAPDPGFTPPSIAVPTITVPTIAVPTIAAPAFDPRITFPEVTFPEVAFPKVRFPELTTPGVVVQQGDDGNGRTTVYTLPADVLFDFDKADIRPDADEALRQTAASLAQRAPGARLLIRGHTDAKGDDAYNVELSERRARAVQAWLAEEADVDTGRTAIQGFGESAPVAANTKPDGADDPAGRQRNRRVEIVAR